MAKISDYLKIGEAAAYLGVHTDTLRRWDRAGKLKARRHPANRFRLYLRSDLDRFLERIGTGNTAKGAAQRNIASTRKSTGAGARKRTNPRE